MNAPPGPQKSLSFALLALFPIVLFAGLWRRSWRLLATSAGLIVAFYFLMLASPPSPNREGKPYSRKRVEEGF